MRNVALVSGIALLLAAVPAAAETDQEAREVDDRGDSLVPRTAVGYRKGRPRKISVVTLGWSDVEVRTAKAFLAMRQAAQEAGIELWIRSGFRSHEQQLMFYQAWREGWGNRAARPGHSNHQSGRALDIYIGDPGIFQWLERNARRFGFKRTVRGEPWHWEYTARPARRPRR
jgi:D-alanyl-D-alanine carboxypeptidase